MNEIIQELRELEKQLLVKLSSGRYVLTIIIGYVFAYLSIKKILPVDKVVEIILLVIYGYFTRDRSKENGGTK